MTHSLTLMLATTLLAALFAASNVQAQAPNKFAHQADITIFPPSASDIGFATAIAPLGDVNGDGFDDLLISSITHAGSAGIVWIFFGSADQSTFDPLNTVQFGVGVGVGDQFGTSIATNGDFNNDTVNDIIIGSPYSQQRTSVPDTGKVYVYSGMSPSFSFLTQWVGAAESDFMGKRVSFFPNVDGVSGDEVLFVSEITGSGSTYNSQMRHGVSAGSVIYTIPNFIVSNAGNVDGDIGGISDIVVGLPNDSTAGANAGHLIYRRGDNGVPIPFGGFGPFGVAGEQFGSDVRFMGDVNNDSIDDVVASGVGFDSSRGRVRIVSGKNVFPDFIHPDIQVFTGEAQGDQFGASIANLGDVTTNGVADVAIGAPFNDAILTNAGRVYVYSSTTGELLHTFTGDVPNEHFGAVVSAAGDFNGDGVPDIAITAPNTPANPDGSSGTVYIFFMPQPCPGDLDGDNDVDAADLATLLASWGNCAPPCVADLNGDGVVDSADLATILANWGVCTPAGAVMGGAAQTDLGGQTVINPSGSQTQQAQSQNGDAFFLSIIGQLGFSDMQSYYDWLDLLSERELSAHINTLIDSLLGQ